MDSDDPTPTPVLSVAPVTETLKLTTEDDYARFRILIVGRSGVGKSSLINGTFRTSLTDVEYNRPGPANINEGITSPHKKHLILHDSQGYEPGDKGKFDILEKFITEQTNKQSHAERLHAIWLCIPASYCGGPLFEIGEDTIFKLNRNKVPIITVITRFDDYIHWLANQGKLDGPNVPLVAEQIFNQTFGHKFEKGGVARDRPIPYALVSALNPDTLQRLAQITMKHIGVESMSPTGGLTPGSDENQSRWAQIALATAARVDMVNKTQASIEVGENKYWGAIASSIVSLGLSFEKCLYAIHKVIVTIWNFQDLHEFLLGDAFRRRVMVIVEDLKGTDTMQSELTVASAQAGSSKLRMSIAYKNGTEHVRCFMGYVVDLTLILQAMFQVSLQDQYEGRVTVDHVDEILYEFHCSEKKRIIHHAIRMVTQHSRPKDKVMEKIQLLLKEHEMTQTDTKLNKDRPPLRSLLTILRLELTANSLVVNRITIELARELLGSPDFRSLVLEIHHSDVELLLNFVLYVLLDHHLLDIKLSLDFIHCLLDQGGVSVSQQARNSLLQVLSNTNTLRRFLFITDVTTKINQDATTISEIGHAFQVGEHKGKCVALQLVSKCHKDAPLRRDLCLELLAWRYLEHRFILPLLGVFEEESRLFLVSPLMVNGTLTNWRKNQTPIVAEIHRLMVEVAEGIQFIHSEGIAHGNLHGGNILLDSAFHCQIADIGATRHFDATTPLMLNFAAPELLGMCNKCYKFECLGCDWNQEGQGKETIQMDVYAFGCLHYAVFFDTVPFQEKNRLQIHRLIARGARPSRLNSPVMDDGIWNLIEQCWMHNPSERPTMEKIVEAYFSFLATLPSLIATLRELAAGGGSIVNDLTHRLMRRLLEQYKSDTIASQLTTTPDVRLFLDLTLHLLHDGSLSNSGVQDLNQKARSLMLKLIKKRDILPKSLFITDVATTSLEAIGFQGEHDGKQVMLQVVYKVYEDDSLRNRFYHASANYQFRVWLVCVLQEVAKPEKVDKEVSDFLRKVRHHSNYILYL